MTLSQWKDKHRISEEAMRDLLTLSGITESLQEVPSNSEAFIQSYTRLRCSQAGMRVWRNNSGAYKDDHNRLIRYGLCNESARESMQTKSSDLIGIRKVLITHNMVGNHIGQFIALECKENGWKFSPKNVREAAQFNFLTIVNSMGGEGRFISSREEADALLY